MRSRKLTNESKVILDEVNSIYSKREKKGPNGGNKNMTRDVIKLLIFPPTRARNKTEEKHRNPCGHGVFLLIGISELKDQHGTLLKIDVSFTTFDLEIEVFRR